MDKLILEIKDILKHYPDYDDVLKDDKNNIIIKRRQKDSFNKNRDTLTDIVKKLLREDLK